MIGGIGLVPLALTAAALTQASLETHLVAAASLSATSIAMAALAPRRGSLLASMLAPRHGALSFALFALAALGPLGAVASGLVSVVWALRHRHVLGVDDEGLGPSERRRALAGIGLAAIVGGAPIALWAAPLALDGPGILERPLWCETSRFQRLFVTRARGAVRLWLDGQLQLESGDEAAYHETLVHPALAAARSVARVLVLGGGDGLVARELVRDARVREIVVVDIDRAVTSLARTFAPLRAIGGHALDDPRVRLVHDDALVWVPAAVQRGERFDVVIGDLPDPSSAVLAPLFARETIASIAALLAEGGVFALQAGAPRTAPRAFASIVRTLDAAGLRTTALAFDEPTAFGGTAVVLGARAAAPQVGALRVTTEWLTPERLAAAHVASVPAARVTTLADLAVLGYLREAMRAPSRWTAASLAGRAFRT